MTVNPNTETNPKGVQIARILKNLKRVSAELVTYHDSKSAYSNKKGTLIFETASKDL